MLYIIISTVSDQYVIASVVLSFCKRGHLQMSSNLKPPTFL